MYKDKDRQREANREAMRRSRGKGITNAGITGLVAPNTCDTLEIVDSKTKRGTDIKVFEDLPPDVQDSINRLAGSNEAEHKRRTAAAIKYQHIFPNSYDSVSDGEFTRLLAKACPGHIRVSKPGDLDYEPECETTRAYIQSKGVAL